MKKIKIYDLKNYFKVKENLLDCYFYKENFLPIETFENTYFYAKSNRYLYLHGLVLAAAVKVKFVDGTTSNLIAVDENFDKLPKHVKKFILLHELGHIKHNDLDKDPKDIKKKTRLRFFGVIPEMELEADKYATSIMGIKEVKAAMSFLAENTNLPITSKIEFIRRYYNLTKSLYK